MTATPSLASLGHLTGIDRIHAIQQAQDTLRADAAYLAFERRAAIAAEVASRGHGGINSLAADLGIGRDKISDALTEHRRSAISVVHIEDDHDVTIHATIGWETPLECSCGWTGRTVLAPHDRRPVDDVVRLRVRRDHLGIGWQPGRLFATDIARRWGTTREEILSRVAAGTMDPMPAGTSKTALYPGIVAEEPYWDPAAVRAVEQHAA